MLCVESWPKGLCRRSPEETSDDLSADLGFAGKLPPKQLQSKESRVERHKLWTERITSSQGWTKHRKSKTRSCSPIGRAQSDLHPIIFTNAHLPYKVVVKSSARDGEQKASDMLKMKSISIMIALTGTIMLTRTKWFRAPFLKQFALFETGALMSF